MCSNTPTESISEGRWRRRRPTNRLLSEVRLLYSQWQQQLYGIRTQRYVATVSTTTQTIRTTLELLYCAVAEGRPSARLCWPNGITVSTQKQRSFSSKTSYNEVICE